MKKKYLKLFLIISITSIIIFFFYDKMNSLDPNSQMVTNLYSLLGGENLNYCGGMPFYTDKRVDAKSFSQEEKMCIAYQNAPIDSLNEMELKKTKKKKACYLNKTDGFTLDDEQDKCTITTVEENALNGELKKIFNIDNKDMIASFDLSGVQKCYYDEENKKYLCGEAIEQLIEVGWAPTLYRVITKVKVKDDSIFINDYFLQINNNKCFTTNDSNNENTDCTTNLKTAGDVDEKFVIDYGQKYIHEFKLDAKTKDYYWVSTTPEK